MSRNPGTTLGLNSMRPAELLLRLAWLARGASTTWCGRYDIETLSGQPITPGSSLSSA